MFENQTYVYVIYVFCTPVWYYLKQYLQTKELIKSYRKESGVVTDWVKIFTSDSGNNILYENTEYLKWNVWYYYFNDTFNEEYYSQILSHKRSLIIEWKCIYRKILDSNSDGHRR